MMYINISLEDISVFIKVYLTHSNLNLKSK